MIMDLPNIRPQGAPLSVQFGAPMQSESRFSFTVCYADFPSLVEAHRFGITLRDEEPWFAPAGSKRGIVEVLGTRTAFNAGGGDKDGKEIITGDTVESDEPPTTPDNSALTGQSVVSNKSILHDFVLKAAGVGMILVQNVEVRDDDVYYVKDDGTETKLSTLATTTAIRPTSSRDNSWGMSAISDRQHV